MQDASPLKIHDIHIFNTVPFFHLVMALIRPFLKTEIANKVKQKRLSPSRANVWCKSGYLFQMHLHSSSVDFEKIYSEFIPRSSMPSDFGGLCDSVEVLHEKMRKEFLEMREYFAAEEKQATLGFD